MADNTNNSKRLNIVPHGELVIDLDAVAENWRTINAKIDKNCQCAAVVKANAYGLGVEKVAPVLFGVGCKSFFVANLAEARVLSKVLPEAVEIFVLSGCRPGEEAEFIHHAFVPILISLEMVQRWAKACCAFSLKRYAVVKINTGMTRLGLDEMDIHQLLSDKALLKSSGIGMVMSHMACADQPQHQLNQLQLKAFRSWVEKFRDYVPDVRASLANSAGIFASVDNHWDMVRPGIALFGGCPLEGTVNPMRRVAALQLPIIQLRDVSPGDIVGYGATKTYNRPASLAIVAGGYADGILRSLSNCGVGFFKGQRVPIVGRVSMDTTIFDVSSVRNKITLGDSIELLGENSSIDELAKHAGTISYEVLTSLGDRYKRRYISERAD